MKEFGHRSTYFTRDSQNKSRPLIPDGLHVLMAGPEKNMKTEGAKNYRVRLGYHQMMTFATWFVTLLYVWSLSLENLLQKFEKELEGINPDILGSCQVRRK